jgi:hypothetical protein
VTRSALLETAARSLQHQARLVEEARWLVRDALAAGLRLRFGAADSLPPALRVVILSNTVSSRRSSKVLAVSVSPEAAQEFDRLAGAEGRNKSELFREMLRVYGIYRETGSFESLQRYGAARARRLGIRDERDVERLIEEARGM